MKKYTKYMDGIRASDTLRQRLVELESPGAPAKRPVPWKKYGGIAAAAVLAAGLGGFGAWTAHINGLEPPIPSYPTGFQQMEEAAVEPDIAPAGPDAQVEPGERVYGGYDVVSGSGSNSITAHYVLPYIEYGPAEDGEAESTMGDWGLPAGATRRDLTQEEIVTLLGGEDAVEQHLNWGEYRLSGWAAWYEDGSFWGAWLNGELIYYGGPSNQLEFAVTAGALPPACFACPSSVTQEIRGLTVTADKQDRESTYPWYGGTRTDSLFDRRVSFMKGDYGYRFEMTSGRAEESEETVSRLVARIADRGLNLASLGGVNDDSFREEGKSVDTSYPEDGTAMTQPCDPAADPSYHPEEADPNPGTYVCQVCGKSFPVESTHFHLLPNGDGTSTCSACGTTIQEGEKHYHNTVDDFMCEGIPVPETPAPAESGEICGYPLNRPEGEAADPTSSTVLSQSEPPSLRVKCAGGAADLRSGSYEWRVEGGDGLTRSTAACGAHPLDFQEEPALTTSDHRVTLGFGVSPDSVTAVCWPDSALKDSSAPAESAQVYRYRKAGDTSQNETPWTITLNPGGWIYEITAQWEQGSAHYAIYIVKN